MIKRVFIILFCGALVLGAGAACSTVEQPSADGSVTVTFRTGEPATRAGAVGDGAVDDGGGIAVSEGVPDLIILIADAESGIIKKRYAPLATDGVTITPSLPGTNATEVSASFTWGNTPGEGVYTVYALANIHGMGNLSIAEGEPDWATMGNVSGLDDLQFAALSDNTKPEVAGYRMPLSAKGTLEVRKNASTSKYNGLVELKMLRCVAKVQLHFKNLTGEVLNLYDCKLTLHDMNPSTGYLFPHDPDFVSGSYRDHTTAGKNLLKIGKTESPKQGDVDGRMLMGDYDAGPPVVDNRTLAALDEVLLFPSTAPWKTTPSKGYRYLCDISFRIPTGETYDPSDASTYEPKEYFNLPIHDSRSKDILSLSRNQFLQIETTISLKGAEFDVSFNFIVNDWVPKTEQVIFH